MFPTDANLEVTASAPDAAIAPITLMMMDGPTFTQQFDARTMDRLGRIAHLTDPAWVTSLDDPRIAAVLPQVQVLLTSWGCPPLSAADLDRMPGLEAIVHAAGSVRAIVPEEAFRRGIQVTNAADANAFPVAEYTLSAILGAGKRTFQAARTSRAARRNVWGLEEGTAWIGNRSRTIGIVGFSRVGRAVVDLLGPHRMEVLVADPYADAAEISAAGATLMPLEELLPRVDVLSIHAPDTPETHGMIGARELAALADRSTVINTARGRLLDHDALARECASGRLSAVLDVTWPEPLPSDSPLWSLDNVLITPHIAGSLGTEVAEMARSAIADLGAIIAHRPPQHAINPHTIEIQA